MTTSRIEWIDQLRGIALFFVVLGHVALSADKISLIYSFHMPLFFIISGLTVNDEKILNIPIHVFIKEKAKKLLIPYLWMNFMMYPLWYITFHIIGSTKTTILQALKGIFYGNNVNYYSAPSNALWFLLVLFMADIIYALIVKITKENEYMKFTLILVCAIIGYLEKGISRIWHYNVAFTAVVFLYIGSCIIKIYRNNKSGFEKMRYICIFGMILLGGILHKCNGRISMTANKFGQSILLFYLTSILFSVAIIFVVVKLPNIQLINFIGKNTLLYVGMHIPVIRLFEKLYPQFWNEEFNCILLAIGVYVGLSLVCHIFNLFFRMYVGNNLKLITDY